MYRLGDLSGMLLLEVSFIGVLLYSFSFPPSFPLSLSLPLSLSAVVDEAKGDSGLAEGLGQELFEGVKERLESDPDYNAQQFPSADKVYQPGK